MLIDALGVQTEVGIKVYLRGSDSNIKHLFDPKLIRMYLDEKRSIIVNGTFIKTC